MKIKVTLVLLSLCIHSVQAQKAKTAPRVEFTSMSIFLGGLITQEGFSNSLDDFKKLAPNSTILANDIANFEENRSQYTINGGSSFSAFGSFNIKKKDGSTSKFHPQFRIGLSYAGQSLLSRNYYQSEFFRIDTLVSNQTGQLYYVDSVETENYNMEYSREQLYIDGAFLISSDPKNRLKVYGGIGLAIGMSINSRTNIRYHKDNYLEAGIPLQNNYSYPYDADYQEEVYLNDEGIMALVSIPFGLELKFSMRENNWANCRLFFEGRPSLSYASIPELGSTVTTASIWGMGFKYDF